MPTVLTHANIDTFHLPGLEHQTLANLGSGTYTMEIWRQSLAAGAVTPWHRHICEEVITVLKGHGECRLQNRSLPFGPDSTLIVESDVTHQIVNTGDEPLELFAVLGMTPVIVQDPSGMPMPLPWDAPAQSAEPLVEG